MARGSNAFQQAGRNMALVIRAGARAGEPALQRVGAQATGEIKRILSKPGEGVVYVRGGRTHQASAPGDPPAVDFGRYRSSWDWTVRKAGDIIELVVGTPDKRAPWLEYGTRRGLLPRPHLRVLVERLRASAAVTRTVGDFIAEIQTRTARGVPRG